MRKIRVIREEGERENGGRNRDRKVRKIRDSLFKR